MSEYNARESLSTLRFGHRAKSIKNQVHANVERSAKELMHELKKAEAKIIKREDIITVMQARVKTYIEDNLEGEELEALRDELDSIVFKVKRIKELEEQLS